MNRKLLLLAGTFSMLAGIAGTARAVDIDEGQILWGFDGQATPNCFNIVSILVGNQTPDPYDGTFKLREENGAGQPVGAVLLADVYVAPFSSRWVQFYPYVKNERNEWRLEWNQGRRETFKLPEPRLGKQTPVLFVEPTGLQARGDAFKHFPEDLFPPMVAATDALQNVVLDHAPRWEESRRQAFMDWLYRGGRVHLVKDITGEFPKFSTGLAELNAPLDRFRIGSGEVIRHNRPRGQLDRDFVAQLTVTSEGGAEKSGAGNNPRTGDNAQASNTATQNARAAPRFPGDYDPELLFSDFAGGMVGALKDLTRPNHSWELIYFMAVLYTLAIFPGLYLLGRRRLDYRLVYGALVGVVLVFSLGFAQVGRRGHGETTGVNTMAIARQLPEGALDVSAWSNVFVIDGDDYKIAHNGVGRLYSSAESFEAVRGEISAGADAGFLVDIPPYSSRPFIHRAKLKQEPFEFQVREYSADKNLSKLSLALGQNFPHPVDAGIVHALYRNNFYSLSIDNDTLQLRSTSGTPVASFFGSINTEEFALWHSTGFVFRDRSTENVAPEVVFERLLRPMMAWSLGMREQNDLQRYTFPGDGVRLFIPAALPDTLHVDNPRLGRQNGRVLYVVDIPKSVTP